MLESSEAMHEPHAGYIVPVHAVALMAIEAIRSGAAIHARERTIAWEATSSGVCVATEWAALYVSDGLHMNAKRYEVWTGVVKPEVVKKWEGR